MDINFPSDTKRDSTINPADLHNDFYTQNLFETYCAQPGTSNLPDLSTVDSAVDLTSFHDNWSPAVKVEPFDQFLDLGEISQASNAPSPSGDMIFSQANSPGDFLREQSQTNSPDTTNDLMSQDVKPPITDDGWVSMFPTPKVIHIPRTLETPHVRLSPDKTKTRAETQIKVQLNLDPLDERFVNIHFPRKTLAKPKLLATLEEKKEAESKGEALHLDLLLVCATAVSKKEDLDRALRRARGEEPIPRRPTGIAISEVDKEDPVHPQNGGEVLICEGCKERERKRYDRKKKRAEDEAEWWSYEDERVIMINEKEYKKWKDVESGDQQFTLRAKQVEFAMRIACYCRHQEEKSPMGYKVIFTFKDSEGNLIVQHTSEIFQITDDHKNKEVAPESLPRPLNIPQTYVQPQYPSHAPNVVPIYQYPVESQYAQPSAMATYSQPPTPIIPNFQSPMSPIEGQFPQNPTPTAPPPLPSTQTYPTASASTAAPAFNRPQAHFEAPPMSPTSQMPAEAQYLPRPLSMDNFNFHSAIQYPQQGFASAPPSAVSTPINLSRPASPTWEQGPNKRKMMCFYFYVDDD